MKIAKIYIHIETKQKQRDKHDTQTQIKTINKKTMKKNNNCYGW